MAVVDLVVATRPNFVKAGALHVRVASNPQLQPRLVHTGQHYDKLMSDVFFQDLDLPEADIRLEIGSGTHGFQTGRTLEVYEQHLLNSRPDGVVVFGDVNATLACALAAAKLHIPVAHVEAGLRSYDMRMPEEINRRMTDVISDLCFVTESAGYDQLIDEGVAKEKCHLVGNVMVDAVMDYKAKLKTTEELQLNLPAKEYGLVTLHRPSNVDNPIVLHELIRILTKHTRDLPLVFPVHPRTRQAMGHPAIVDLLTGLPSGKVRMVQPFGYVDMLSAMASAKCVLSDSGGIQSESTTLNIPCLTLRTTTEQPVTVSNGTVTLVGADEQMIRGELDRVFDGSYKQSSKIAFWDGNASERITDILVKEWAN